MSDSQNLFNRFLSIFSGKVITTIIAIISTPIIVRLLGPGGYGNYAVLLSIFSLYMIPVSAGITQGVQKFVAENRNTPHWREFVIRFYLLLAMAIVLFGAGVLVGFTSLGYAEIVFGDGFTLYFYLLTVYVFISQFRAVGYHIVLGFNLEPISESFNVGKKLVTVLLGIGLLLHGLGVAGMIIGHIAANLLVTLTAGYVIVRRISTNALFQTPESFPYRELLSFNGQNILLVFLIMSLFHVDIIMVRTLVGSNATGYYKAALALAEYLWFVPIALQALLLHSSSRLWSDNRHDEITVLAGRTTRYTLLLVTLMAIGLAILADRFIPLYYGEPFTVAVGPLLLLLPGVVGFAVARPLQSISQGSGRLKTLIIATGAAAMGNLTLNALLIPLAGMNGAAVATSISYGSMFFFFVWAARRIGYDPLNDFRGLRIAGTALIAAPPILLIEQLILSDNLALILIPPLGAFIFSAAALITGAIDVDEVLDILRNLPDPIAKIFGANRLWAE